MSGVTSAQTTSAFPITLAKFADNLNQGLYDLQIFRPVFYPAMSDGTRVEVRRLVLDKRGRQLLKRGVPQYQLQNLLITDLIGYAQVTVTNASITITGAVTISGTPNVAVTNTPSVNVANAPTVNIGASNSVSIGSSGSVAINAGTAVIGAVNTQQSQRAFNNEGTVSNDGGGTPPNLQTLNVPVGKEFPHVGIGTVRRVKLWLNNLAAAPQSVTIGIAPLVGMAAIQSITFTQAASTNGFVEVLFNFVWNYDSMFLWNTTNNANLQLGWDGLQPYDDYFLNADFSINDQLSRRYYIQVSTIRNAQAIPVAGTVNNIQIPNSVGGASIGATNVANATEASLFTLNGTGRSLKITVNHAGVGGGNTDNWQVRLYIDGSLMELYSMDYTLNSKFIEVSGGSAVYGQPTNVANSYKIWTIYVQYPFRRSLEVRVYNDTGFAQNFAGSMTAEILA